MAWTLPTGFVQDPVASGWNEGVGLTFADNGSMFVWERGGRVWIVEGGSRLSEPLVDIREEVAAWRDHGLLGFALDPAYLVNGHVYLLYAVDRHHLLNFGTGSYDPNTTITKQASIGRVVRYTARASDGFRTVDPSTRLVLIGETMDTGIPLLHESHGVGTLLFAADNTLLVSTGDGASFSAADLGGGSAGDYSAQALADGIIASDEDIGAFRSQYLGSLNGKILRVDPATGDGVSSNPFYDIFEPRSARSRTWALGLRNPFRVAIRDETGSHVAEDGDPGVLYVGDVGWNAWEELHVIDGPGENAGWPIFEGMELTPSASYVNADTRNLLAANPLGCESHFRFTDLITQDTLDPTPFFPNPCNPGQAIPGNVFTFVHNRPVLDWSHSGGVTRVGVFDGLDADTVRVGELNSPVSGPEFSGRSSTGGVWYSGHAYPAEYHDVYFLADYDGQWLRLIRFDDQNRPFEIEDFSGGQRYVSLAVNPVDECLYFADWNSGVWKITYDPGGNRPPTAVASVDQHFGPSPLTVQFKSTGSMDPEGGALTYEWDFGDDTPVSTLPNPMYTYSSSAGVPTRFGVTLTVRDADNNESVDTLLISVNNTPPRVTITSPVNGTRYPLDQGNIVYDFEAVIEDDEHSGGNLACAWENILHHNDHTHQDPPDTNCSTTGTIAPVGCDGQIYYYRLVLTVTDAAGLSTTDEVILVPDCPNVAPIANDDVAEMGRGQSIEIDVLDNDLDPVGVLDPTTVVIEDAPSAGSAAVDPLTGVITYTHNGSGTASDSLRYTVRDDDDVVSNEAEVVVTIDVVSPTLVVAYSASPNSVVVQFSEPVSTATAGFASNYDIDNGVTVNSATPLTADSVSLGTTTLPEDQDLTLTVNGVEDLLGNVIAIDSQVVISISAVGGPPMEGLAFWLDGSAGVVANGSDVLEWQDQSIGGAQQVGIAVSRPQLVPYAFPNGTVQDVVRFDGNDGFDFPDEDALELSSISIYAVLRHDVSNPVQCILANYRDVIGFGFGISDGHAGRIKWFSSPPAHTLEPAQGTLQDDRVTIVTATFGNGTKALYFDGQEVGSVSGIGLDYGGGNRLTVGYLMGNRQYFRGDIAEILVYDAVDSSQQAVVETYLTERYITERDVAPPTLESARRGFSGTEVIVTFSEEVVAVTAGDSSNFTISGGVSVFAATVTGPETVELTTSKIVDGSSVTLTVNNVTDLSGNPIASNSSIAISIPPPGPPVENRRFWLAADNGAHTHGGGDAVTEWHDISGSPVVHDGSAIGEPQLTTTLFPNGQMMPVVRFDGNDGFLHDHPEELELTSVSVYAVIRPDVTFASQCILANFRNVTGLGFGISDTIAGRIKWFTAPPVNSMEVPGADLADDTPVLLTATFGGGEKRLYVDGGLVGSASGLDIAYGGTVLTTGNLLGVVQFFTGDIAELIVYGSVSTEQQDHVEGYLIDKYFTESLRSFRRGDCDGDGDLTIVDPLVNLIFQFEGLPVTCPDALDFDDNGVLSIEDPIGNLIHQFNSGPPPAPPGVRCGVDPSPDVGGDLGCMTDC